jgi:ABC-type sugar transport system substrate-binding protein
MLKKLMKLAAAAALPATLALAAYAPPVHAESDKLAGGNSSAELKKLVDSKLVGKRVAWMPTTLGFPLTDMWTYVMQKEADHAGIDFIVRDPNWNPTTMTQIVSSLITEHPDVLIVHNLDVQLLAKQLQKAEQEGIFVIQVNMVSNYKTDAYVGADWIEVGRTVGEDVVKTCGEGTDTSHKVAVVQGDLTSAASLEQYAGFKQAVEKDPTIEIVSDQAANWDATKANNVTATVLQQHPDLCATFGFWGTMQNGAAQAVKAAGKLDQVKVYASGEGNRFDCNNVRDGLFYKFLNYDAPAQARDIMNMAEFLLQSGLKPGDAKMADYSSLSWITKDNFDPSVCFDVPEKS